MSFKEELNKYAKKQKKEMVNQVNEILGIEKPFKMKFYTISDSHFQVQMTKNMLFEAEANKDGTVNFHVINTDFKKIKLGKNVSLKKILELQNTKLKFKPEWIDTFMKNIVMLQNKMITQKKQDIKNEKTNRNKH